MGCVALNGELLIFIYQYLEVLCPVRIANQVNTTTQFFIPFENAFTIIIQHHRIHNGQLPAIVMSQIDPLILKRLECDLDLVAILGKKRKRNKSRKNGGSIFHSLNLSRKN